MITLRNPKTLRLSKVEDSIRINASLLLKEIVMSVGEKLFRIYINLGQPTKICLMDCRVWC